VTLSRALLLLRHFQRQPWEARETWDGTPISVPDWPTVKQSILKGHQLSSAFSFEIRADIFNIFNRVNLTQPVSNLSSGQFGHSTSQNLPRSAQFGLHFSF